LLLLHVMLASVGVHYFSISHMTQQEVTWK